MVENGSPWWIKAGKEFGFPVMITLILLSGLGFIGKWLLDAQDIGREDQRKLIESTIKTNDALTTANNQNSQTLREIERTLAASSATVLDAVESNGRLIGQHFDATKTNQLLNQKQVELLEQVSKTHANQIDQLGKITDIMSSANKMMEPVIVQRQEMLKKQDNTNQKLDELINAVQKSK